MSKIDQPKTSAIEQGVMDQIKSGHVRMHKRTYYTWLAVLATATVALLAIATAYFMSIAILWLRIDAATGQAYGAKRNLSSLIEAYPWWSIILGVLLIGLIIYLIRKVGNLYKVPLFVLIPLIILMFAVFGLALSYTNLPDVINHQDANPTQNKTQVKQGSQSNGPNSTNSGYRRGQ